MTSPRIVVIAPDSFKGSLTSIEAAQAMALGIQRVWPDAECRLLPMADGGEGTLDACLHEDAAGERLQARVRGAGLGQRDAQFGITQRDGKAIAVIEVAQVVGITDSNGMAAPVGQRTTFGVGELLRQVLDRGVRDVMLGLGGSSTNDGGAGLLVGLGARLLDAAGQAVEPVPNQLQRVVKVDLGGLDARIAQCRLTILSDVNNPLTGPHGATAVFGPQKGVTPDLQARFDAAIGNFAECAEQAFQRAVRTLPGAGAAGGLGFACRLLGGTVHSGAEVIVGLLQLDRAIEDAGWVLTGEGRSDAQTLHGKTPEVVARHARQQRLPVTLLSGSVDRTALPALNEIFDGCFSLTFGPSTLPELMADSRALLADAAGQLACLMGRS